MFDGDKLECRKCRYYPPEQRVELGCFSALSPSPYEFKGCYICDGANPKCEVCGGSNRWSLDRCPGSQVDRDAMLALQAASFSLEHGVLPSPGGIHDQTMDFLAVCGILGAERQKRMPKMPKGKRGK
jgi:hypothetical protein